MRAKSLVERLLAEPVIHPRNNVLSVTERARRRHAFFRALQREVGLRDEAFVHVAGTKGKGSVCELVRAGLVAEGFRVGTFTSPHLHSVCERIRVGSEPVAFSELERVGAEALRRVEAVDTVVDDALTEKAWGAVFFDRLLAAALLHFGERGCDAVVMEAGIGGLYDSTNFLDTHALGVVTSISKDHTALLGDTLADIAAHKAGIARNERPLLTAASLPPEALDVVRSEAQLRGARLEEVHGGDDDDDNRALADRACRRFFESSSSSSSDHQDDRHPSFKVDFSRARWPGRFEELAVRGTTVLVDCAHNGASVRRLLRSLPSENRWHVVFGCGHEKEDVNEDMLSVLVDEAHRFTDLAFAEAGIDKDKPLPPQKQGTKVSALSERVLAKLSSGGNKETFLLRSSATPPSTRAVLDATLRDFADDAILVCGSVYVAAEAREWAVETDPTCLPPDDWARRHVAPPE